MSEDVIGTGSPAEATPSAPVAPTATTAPVGSQAPATGAPPDGYVPSYRIRETREAAIREAQQSWSQREAQIRQEADQYKRQLQALVGVQPPKNPEVDAVRQQFGQLYPGLATLEEKAKQLEALLERAGDQESQVQHYWQTYGRSTMDNLFKEAETSIGAPLNTEGKNFLHSSFVGWVQADPARADRYASDPGIVKEFWKGFSSGFIDPVRRTSSAQVAGRVGMALPQDTTTGAPRVPGPPKPADLDERVNQALAHYNAVSKTKIPSQSE